jgi:hypothetical protein
LTTLGDVAEKGVALGDERHQGVSEQVEQEA